MPRLGRRGRRLPRPLRRLRGRERRLLPPARDGGDPLAGGRDDALPVRGAVRDSGRASRAARRDRAAFARSRPPRDHRRDGERDGGAARTGSDPPPQRRHVRGNLSRADGRSSALRRQARLSRAVRRRCGRPLPPLPGSLPEPVGRRRRSGRDRARAAGGRARRPGIRSGAARLRPRRTDSGERRCSDPARRLPPRSAEALRSHRHAARLRRDPVRLRAQRPHVGVGARGRRPRSDDGGEGDRRWHGACRGARPLGADDARGSRTPSPRRSSRTRSTQRPAAQRSTFCARRAWSSVRSGSVRMPCNVSRMAWP